MIDSIESVATRLSYKLIVAKEVAIMRMLEITDLKLGKPDIKNVDSIKETLENHGYTFTEYSPHSNLQYITLNEWGKPIQTVSVEHKVKEEDGRIFIDIVTEFQDRKEY